MVDVKPFIDGLDNGRGHRAAVTAGSAATAFCRLKISVQRILDIFQMGARP